MAAYDQGRWLPDDRNVSTVSALAIAEVKVKAAFVSNDAVKAVTAMREMSLARSSLSGS